MPMCEIVTVLFTTPCSVYSSHDTNYREHRKETWFSNPCCRLVHSQRKGATTLTDNQNETVSKTESYAMSWIEHIMRL